MEGTNMPNEQNNNKIFEQDPRYHNTRKLLGHYRDASYSLKVVVRQLEYQFKTQYGNSIDEFLDSAYMAGMDLGNCEIQEHTKSIERSNKMLKLLNSSVELLRENHKYGEQYYWFLYYAFLSLHEPQNTDEILDNLEKHMDRPSYRTYYRKRNDAIRALSIILWGYTAQETSRLLDQLLPEE
jgi:hypothetical protein